MTGVERPEPTREEVARVVEENDRLNGMVADVTRDHARLDAENERLREALEAGQQYIDHLRENSGHTLCRRVTGPGSYQCKYRLAYEAALTEKGEQDG